MDEEICSLRSGPQDSFCGQYSRLSFPGKPLVEASEDLRQFQGTGRSVGCEIYIPAPTKKCSALTDKLLDFEAAFNKEYVLLRQAKRFSPYTGNKTTSTVSICGR